MSSWRSPNFCRRTNSALLVGGSLLFLGGCNALPFRQSAQTHESATTAGGVSDWPSSTTSADDRQPAQYHEVRAGETLSKLASMYGLTVPQLLNANRLDAAASLKPGQLLQIPRTP